MDHTPPSVPLQQRWRKHASSSAKSPTPSAPKQKSTGVDPSSFYDKKAGPVHASERKLRRILHLAARNEVVQLRSEYTAAQKRQRADYICSTSLKNFPLQEMALDFLDSLMKEFRGVEEPPYQSGRPSRHADIADGAETSAACARDCKRRKPMQQAEANENTDVEHCPARFQQETSMLWSMEPRIFSAELSLGKRRYIVGQLGRFCQYYWRDTDPKSRHYYELIREETPCRLFFDLEFCKLANPRITAHDGEVLMAQFIRNVCTQLELTHGIRIDRSGIVDLDSSTNNKFSRHLIIHMPRGELFADARAAGVFAKRLVGRLADELSTGVLARNHDVLAKYLFVNRQAPKSTLPPSLDFEEAARHVAVSSPTRCTDHKALTCFIDLGVYTRNRLFRLMGSTKVGKSSSAALRIAGANEFTFPPGFCNETFFLADQTPPDTKPRQKHIGDLFDSDPTAVSKQRQNHDAFCASLDWETHAQALAMTLVVPAYVSTSATAILGEPNGGKVAASGAARRATSSRRNCSGDSPIPQLDAFVRRLSKRGGIQGKIRAWSMEGKPLHASYHMSENRFCENVQRSHRSNNVMWNVDLASKSYWQTCHDPECRAANFRGRASKLPEDVAAHVDDYLLDREIAELDEDEIIRGATRPDADYSDAEFDARLADVDMSLFTPRSDSTA